MQGSFSKRDRDVTVRGDVMEAEGEVTEPGAKECKQLEKARGHVSRSVSRRNTALPTP